MLEHDDKLDKLQSDFKKFYDKNLIEDYERVERFRVFYLVLFVILFLSSTGVLLYILNHLCKNGFSVDDAGLFMRLLGVGIFICFFPAWGFNLISKMNVMEKFVSFFDGMKYGENSINEEDLKKSDLFHSFNECRHKDCFSGCYKGVNINISEMKLLVYNMASRRYNSNYNGVVIKIDLNENKKGKIVGFIKFDKVLYRDKILILSLFMLPILICALFFREFIIPSFIPLFLFLVCSLLNLGKESSFGYKNNKQLIKLEDVVFSKKWNIYADDQIEARYVLTPALMERLLEIKSLFNSVLLEFSFCDNQLLISLPGANMFETTTLFRSALSYDGIKKVVNEFYCIFSIIEILKLENKKLKRR